MIWDALHTVIIPVVLFVLILFGMIDDWVTRCHLRSLEKRLTELEHKKGGEQ